MRIATRPLASISDVGDWSRAEQIDLALLDGKRDQPVDDPAEGFIVGKSFLNLCDAVGANETAHRFAVIDVGEFVVRAVTLRSFRIHTATPWVSADLVLKRDASRMQKSHSEQFPAEGVDFSFQLKNGLSSIHGGYDI